MINVNVHGKCSKLEQALIKFALQAEINQSITGEKRK